MHKMLAMLHFLIIKNLICSQTNVLWSHIDLSLVGPIRRMLYLNMIDLISKGPEVLSINSATSLTASARYNTTAHAGVYIRIHHRKYIRPQYATVSSETKKNPKKIFSGHA
ncbi:hypothetical protein ACTXT7_006133 [Hymenolepis weldensis]